jgi:lipoprotein-anchoring transpeptidase ErfK/SrfK
VNPSFGALAMPLVGDRLRHMRRVLSIFLLLGVVAAASAAQAGAETDAWKSRLAGLPAASRVVVAGAGPLQWRSVAVRRSPDRAARVVTTMKQFRKDFRPQYILATEQRTDPVTGAATWYRITVPGRPNGRTGWIPAAAVDLSPVDRWLVIHRDARKFEFFVRGERVRTGVIAVGASGMETPLGLFYVQWKFKPEWEVLGAYALETSGYSKLSDWPGGGIVGVHGTNTPWLLGQAVSHGCVRLHNEDILFLRPHVSVGTPIKIVA